MPLTPDDCTDLYDQHPCTAAHGHAWGDNGPDEPCVHCGVLARVFFPPIELSYRLGYGPEAEAPTCEQPTYPIPPARSRTIATLIVFVLLIILALVRFGVDQGTPDATASAYQDVPCGAVASAHTWAPLEGLDAVEIAPEPNAERVAGGAL